MTGVGARSSNKYPALITTSGLASNPMVAIKDLTEDELNLPHKFYKRFSDQSEKDQDKPHSTDLAENLQKEKGQLHILVQYSIRSQRTASHNLKTGKVEGAFTYLNEGGQTFNVQYMFGRYRKVPFGSALCAYYSRLGVAFYIGLLRIGLI